MTKKSFLLVTLLMVVAFGTSLVSARTVPDSSKAAVNFPKTVLINQSLDRVVNDPDTSLVLAEKILQLPLSKASNQEKIHFFQMLAGKLESVHHYKQALACYKIADSLAALKLGESDHPGTRSTGHGLPETFYLFVALVVLFLLFFGYSVAGFFKFNARRKTLQEKQNRLTHDLERLQSELDEKVKTDSRSLHEKLENLRETEVALKSALKKAEEAAFLRNAFIANLGFDVRTPLNGIIGFANMLETELAVQENKELYDFASSIAKSGHRLLKLLNNVIDLSSIESNTLKLDILPVSPEATIQKVFNHFSPPAGEKNLIFKCKIDPELRPVLADEKFLEKILSQVVDNAVKYTTNGFVTLSALYDPQKDIDVIEIKDTGPGIDKKHQNLLFELDAVVDGQPLKYGEGTGIGLKLVKRLVDLMHAGLELESKPGAGTTFRLFFPCSKKAVIEKTQPREKPVEVTMASELGDLDIFVVEDDRMNRIILEKMLKNMGSVKLAVDGKDCMEVVDREAAKKHFFQIMLFDINLPGDKDGVALMKEIRNKYPEYRKVPFIAQTAYAMTEDEEFFLKEGFDSYLSKPINRDELISTIKQQFSVFYPPATK